MARAVGSDAMCLSAARVSTQTSPRAECLFLRADAMAMREAVGEAEAVAGGGELARAAERAVIGGVLAADAPMGHPTTTAVTTAASTAVSCRNRAAPAEVGTPCQPTSASDAGQRMSPTDRRRATPTGRHAQGREQHQPALRGTATWN